MKGEEFENILVLQYPIYQPLFSLSINYFVIGRQSERKALILLENYKNSYFSSHLKTFL